MRRSIIGGCLTALLLVVSSASAQDEAPLFAQVRSYYQGEQYEKAEEALHEIVDQNPESARAHYLLSRLYFSSPLKNLDRADDALHRAIDLDPNNVQYLVARLEFLRRDANNFIVERIRDEKRRRLAHDILALDSTNAVAHEELGVSYIHDFWRYRNAVNLPNLEFGPVSATGREANPADIQEDVLNTFQGGLELEPASPEDNPVSNLDRQIPVPEMSDQLLPPDQVFVADQFDLAQMKQQGIAVQDLSGRATYAYDQAIEHLTTALNYDPRRRSVYDHLMQIYVLKGEAQRALDMLSTMYVQYPKDPKLWLYLGYAQFQSHSLDAATESFRQALTFMPAKERGAFQSLDMLLSEQEKEQYAEDSTAYAQRFWTSKDPRYLTEHNERRLEHFARLVYADLLYGAPDIGKRGWDTRRGRILVRYGPPPVDVIFTREQIDMRSSTGMEEDFSAQQFDAGTVFNVWDYGQFKFVFEDPFRNGEFRLYSPPASAIGSGQMLPFENDYVLKARETFREVPDRYEYEAPGRKVNLPYLVNAFKGEDGKTDIYVHYGVPISAGAENGEMVDATLRVGTFLISENREILAQQKNTVYGLQPSKMVSFQDVTLWTDTKQMASTPGEHQLSMEFETSGAGAVGVQRRDIKVPDYGSDELMISNVLLSYGIEASPDGQPLSQGEIVRNGLSMRPAPWSVFSGEQPVYIYFEAYNLEKDASGQTRYDVEAALIPKDDSKGIAKFFNGLFGGEEGVSVQYEGSGTANDANQYLILDATDRDPGLYTLIVQIHDTVSGETTETERDLYLE